MPYNFHAVFSGPCAYVPNRVGGAGPAPSWSVILLNLRAGWSNATQAVDRHHAVVQYDPALWDASEKPDLELTINGAGGRKSSLFWLRATQVSFVLPDASAFVPNFAPVPLPTRRDPQLIELLLPNQLASLVWLAFVDQLEPGFGVFGLNSASYFDQYGLPDPEGPLAAHVLLRHGDLITHELDRAAPNAGGLRLATIWDFRDPNASRPSNRFVQAVANSVALRAERLRLPSQVILKQPGRTITLTSLVTDGEVSLEIKNRELEEIVGRPLEEDESQVDRDFRFLYNHDREGDVDVTRYPLPHLVQENGAGNESATCGGSGFKGFSERFAGAIGTWTTL